MNLNSPSEKLNETDFQKEYWALVHETKDVLLNNGFINPIPPLVLKQAGKTQTLEAHMGTFKSLEELKKFYQDKILLNCPWPEIKGTLNPLAIILSPQELTSEELDFATRWFENDRVKMVFKDSFTLVPLPPIPDDVVLKQFFKHLCEFYRPKALFSLGPEAATKLLGTELTIETLRSSDFPFESWPLVTTYHPSAYFEFSEQDPRRNSCKAQIWKDVQRLLGKLRNA